MGSIDYCTMTVPDNQQCRDLAVEFNTSMCKGDTVSGISAYLNYITCLSESGVITGIGGPDGTNTLASFSKLFPDNAYDQTKLNLASNNYVNGTGELSAVVAFKTNLSKQIVSLQSYQSNLIASTPEYINKSESLNFLSSIHTVNIEATDLQNKLGIIDANVQNLQSKATGNMSAITFYIYTTITVVMGILCILLIVYLVYMYLDPSSGVFSSPMRGGKRHPV